MNQHVNRDSPTAAWGNFDRGHTTNQAIRCGVLDPFENRPHIAVDELVKAALGIDTKIEREYVRSTLKIDPISDRHRALSDSADLIAFDVALSMLTN